jgi:hypothetical protein
MSDGPELDLSLIDELLARGELESYHLADAARADLCRRLGRTSEVRSSYERAPATSCCGSERHDSGERTPPRKGHRAVSILGSTESSTFDGGSINEGKLTRSLQQ